MHLPRKRKKQEITLPARLAYFFHRVSFEIQTHTGSIDREIRSFYTEKQIYQDSKHGLRY